MRDALLARNVERFADSNAFLHAVLGAISAAGALNELLERAAPGEHGASSQSGRHAGQREQVLSALLGLIAIDQTLRASVSRAVVSERKPVAANVPANVPALRALLK